MKKLIVSLCLLGLFPAGNLYTQECVSGDCKNGQGTMTYFDEDGNDEEDYTGWRSSFQRTI